MALVIFHISAPYILILVLVLMFLAFQVLLSDAKVCLAFAILVRAPFSVSSLLLITVPRWLNCSTSLTFLKVKAVFDGFKKLERPVPLFAVSQSA